MTTPTAPAPPSRLRRILTSWVLPLVGFAVIFVVVGRLRGPSLDGPAPDFTLMGLHGEPVSLADLQGKPVVLNFWATWCLPCKAEIPSFSAFANNHPDIHVIGVTADGPAPKVAHFAQEAGISYTVLMGDDAVQRAYGVSAYPTTVVLDAEGNVVTTHTGVMLRPQLWWATRGL